MINAHRESWLAITLPTDPASFDAPFIKAALREIHKGRGERIAQASAYKKKIDTTGPRARFGLHFKLTWEGDRASVMDLTAMPGDTVWINLLRRGLTMASPFAPFDGDGYDWANTVEPGTDQKAIEAIHRLGHEMNAKDIQDLREEIERLKGVVDSADRYFEHRGNVQGDGLHALAERLGQLEDKALISRMNRAEDALRRLREETVADVENVQQDQAALRDLIDAKLGGMIDLENRSFEHRDRLEKLEHLHTQTEAVLDMQRQHLHDLTHRDFDSELVKHLRQIADALDQTGGE